MFFIWTRSQSGTSKEALVEATVCFEVHVDKPACVTKNGFWAELCVCVCVCVCVLHDPVWVEQENKQLHTPDKF